MTSFYLRDTRSNTGSSCMFWAENGNGYTTNLDRAHVYTLEEAQSHFNDRHTDVPLSKALVDELVTVRVDHQYLDESQGVKSPMVVSMSFTSAEVTTMVTTFTGRPSAVARRTFQTPWC